MINAILWVCLVEGTTLVGRSGCMFSNAMGVGVHD